MMRRMRDLAFGILLLEGAFSTTVAAQEAVTVTGHVLAATGPVRGATVRIEALNIGAVSTTEGRYSFIIPSALVRGQSVSLTASYPRLRSRSVLLTLVGGSVVQDFDLSAADAPAPARVDRPRVRETSPGTTPSPSRPETATATSTAVMLNRRAVRLAQAPLVDSSAFSDLAGPVDLPSALAGRFAALDIMGTSTLGGTSSMQVRGPRSLSGLTQPLVVVNGIVTDNSNLSNAAQLAGRGGFDYGSGINDLNVDDIATVELLTGPFAAMRFGGRAANSVLLVTTKSARGLTGLTVSASQSVSNSTVLRLPKYQDLYGQGLGGKFSFFDGRGGGISDTTDQSWGPALDGSPVLQASFTEAGRPDVRAWFPQPGNVTDYYASGRTLGTNLSIQNGYDAGQFRASVSNRTSGGVTPRSSIARRSAVVTGSAQPGARLSLSGDLQLYSDRGEDRSGTGIDESNTVSTFAHTPRQVDFASYMTRLRDANLQQLSWNYGGRNNPYWSALENDNHDSRSRYVAGGSASYAISSWVTASLRAGTDHTSESRSFTVTPGWMGGFPYFAGRGNFSTGGFQVDDITSSGSDAEVLLRAAPRSSGLLALTFTLGAGRHSDDIQWNVRGADRLIDTTTPPQVRWNGSSSTNTVFGGAEARVGQALTLGVSARSESSVLGSGASVSTLYPAVVARLELAGSDSGAPRGGALQSFELRGGWSRSGNVGSAGLLQRLGVTTTTAAAAIAQLSAPERTTSLEVGVALRGLGGRASADVSVYRDMSENLLFPSAEGYARSGSLSNKGIEATVSAVPLRLANGFEWSVSGTFGKNTNLVESVAGGTSVALGPASGGASIEARSGASLGVIVGSAFLRDGRGQLMLRNGRPLADSIGGSRVLGETAPSWIGGLRTSARMHGVELSVQFDTHQGGRVFSASNLAGAYSGVLLETAFRPDTGLLIAGLDVVTGIKNTVHVTTEDYFHSLGGITERWIYDASFVKLRDARASVTVPLQFIPALRVQSLRASLIGRNLALWTSAANIDPETVLGASSFRGAELGQLPGTRSLGFQLTLTP